MTPERWRRIEQLFDELADLPPLQQDARLERACVDAPELLEELRRLLAHDRGPNRIAEIIEGVSRLPPPEETSFEGRRLGPWRIVGELGRGGMGVVFEAVRDDDAFEKRVALKVAARAAYSP